jgi:hypothetical protein
MTDQTRHPSQRGNAPQARPAADGRFSRRPEDPLAELARLIGQDDPFSEMSGNVQRPARSLATPVARPAQPPRQPNGNGTAAYTRSTAQPASASADVYEDDRYDEAAYDNRAPSQAYGRQYEDEAYDYDDVPPPPRQRVPAPQNLGRGAYSYGGAPLARAEAPPPARPAQRQQPVPPQDDYADPQYDDRDPNYRDADYRDGNGYDYNDPYQQPAHATGRQAYHDGQYQQDYAPEYDNEYPPEEYPEEYAEPRSNRRWLLIGIMSLVGIIVLGVAGVYGYRAVFKKNVSANPPTIRSTEAPTKMAPAAPQANADGTKQSYDRIGEAPPATGERVISREEQPSFNSPPGSRTVTTTPVGSSGSASAFAPSSQTPALTPPSSSTVTGNGEPRRVRTMTVRSDGSVVNNNARPSSRSNAPLSLNPNAPAEPQDAGEPVSQPGPRSSLPSGTQAYASVEPPARVQQSSYAPAGSYVVQVSSQKTEADAHTAWRQLQSRYTNVLSDAQVTFKRVDLGDRGTFYRAMVGPYANRDQAYEVCQNLKAAGGECVVQRN